MKRVTLLFITLMVMFFPNSVSYADSDNGINQESEEVISLLNEYPIEGTSKYSSKRLIVNSTSISETYGAIDTVEAWGDYTLLQYTSEYSTMLAYNKLSTKYNVYIDEVLKVESSEHSFVDSGASKANFGELYSESSAGEEVGVLVIGTGWNTSLCNSDRLIENISYYEDGKLYCNNHETEVGSLILDNTPSNIKLYSIRIQDWDSGEYTTTSRVQDSLEYALNNDNIDIVNMSFDISKEHSFPILESKISELTEKGKIVIVSAGNSAESISYSNGVYNFPSGYKDSWTIGSVSKNKNISSFSNYGDAIDFVSWGENIALPTGGCVSGTSFSAPYISSFVAMLKACNKYSTEREAYGLVKSMCEDLGGEGYDTYYGWGLPLYIFSTSCSTGSHTWVFNKVLKDADCFTKGTTQYKCSKCGELKAEEDISQLEHSFTCIETSIPTCTEDGVKRLKCNYCGIELEQKYMDALGHSYVEKQKTKATCVSEGRIKYICSTCGDNYTKVLPIDNENHSSIVEEDIDSNCSKEGYHKKYCKDCGTIMEYNTKEKLTHQYTVTDKKSPTDKSEGYVKYKCVLCCHEYTVVIDKLDSLSSESQKDSSSSTSSITKDESISTKNYTKDNFSWKGATASINKGKKAATVTFNGKFKPYTYAYIKYSTSKSMKGYKIKRVKIKSSGSKKKFSVGGLKKGKTYYFQVKYCEKSGGSTYYSKKWSSKKKVKVK